MTWIERLYNLILLGPPGVGKSHLDIGLGIEAFSHGYKVMFVSMGDLVQLLKTEDITRKSQLKMKRIRDAELVRAYVVYFCFIAVLTNHPINYFNIYTF